MGTIPQTAIRPLFLARGGVFGDDFAPPRQLYMVIFPAILTFAGFMSWALGNDLGMVLAAAAGSAVGVFSLWDWLFRHAPTRFSTLMGMAFLLGYGLGTMNTWFTLSRGSLSLGEFVGLGEGVLARGIGAVLISSSLLFFFGEIFEKPLFGRDFRLQIDRKARILIYAGTLAFIAEYLMHRVSFAGAQDLSNHHPGAYTFFLTFLYGPLTGMSVVYFLSRQNKYERLLSGLAMLFLLMRLAVEGRRAAIYTCFIIILLLGLAGFRWREKIFHKVLLLLALTTIVVACSLTFMLLRIAGGFTPNKHLTLDKRVAIAGRMIRRGNGYTLALKTTQRNIETRTFVLGFLANIQEASSRMTPALGRDAAGMFQSTIPHVLYPNKEFLAEEQLVDRQFGFNYGDEANSVLTAGATDFGLIGMLLYPLIVVVLFKVVHNFLSAWLSPIPLIVVTISFIACMMLTESTLSGYFETLRDVPLFGGVLMLFLALPITNRTGN